MTVNKPHYIYGVDELMQLTEAGIGHIESFPELIKEFFPADESEPEHSADEEWMARQEQFAQLAKSEIERDFPLLHGHALIGIWGALEYLIEDLAVAWLDGHPPVLSVPAIAKIRIPLADFEVLDHQDRLRFIVSELQRELKVDLRSGATKFEPLLAIFDLDGPVDDRVRRSLYEAQQLRNVLAHRGGVADRKFVQSCPQLNYAVGDSIVLTGDEFSRFMNGLLMYVTTVNNRCCKLEGWEPILFESPGFEGALTKLNDPES